MFWGRLAVPGETGRGAAGDPYSCGLKTGNAPVDGIVFKIQKYALHDGPGIRTTVFLKGCPLRCRWCHNPEGQRPQPEEVLVEPGGGDGRTETVGRRMTAVEVMADVERDRLFYDESGGGVTFSGGEPLSQPEFLETLLGECRRREIHAAVDTCGEADPAVALRVLPMADLVLFDLKLMDPARHREATGVDNRRILENLAAVSAAGVEVAVRIPLVRGVNDDMDNLERTAAFLRRETRVRRVDLLPYHRIADGKYRRLRRDNPMTGVAGLTAADCAPARDALARAGIDAALGG